MKHIAPVLLILLALSACERRADPDPFAVPGAMTLTSEFVGYRDGEEKVAATALGRALPRVADPCGGPDGARGVSEAWVRSKVIEAGHDREMACQEMTWSRDGNRPPYDADAPRPPLDEIQARTAMHKDYLRLMGEANVEQVRLLREQQGAGAAEG